MENNPKKSKAFIITFILILLLLLVGYYLFTNRDKIFDTKGSTSISKIFAPLLGGSKDKNLTVINDQGQVVSNNAPAGAMVATDINGNKMVRAEAGEDLKKCDAVYISGFNKNKDPIVMKAIANDPKKSVVFGFAGEDIKKGTTGNIVIQGILSVCNTQRTEGTPWTTNNQLYLSNTKTGDMTKNPPSNAGSIVVPLASILKVDPVVGSINIFMMDYLKNVNNLDKNISDYLKSLQQLILGLNTNTSNTLGSDFSYIPVEIPGYNNTGDNYPTVIVTAAKSSINEGESTTISWTSKKATSCNAGKGNGTGVSGSFDTGPLTKTTAYAVSCTGPGGSNGGNTFVIVANTNTDGQTNFPNITVKAEPSSIKAGESSTITWESTNTTSCTLSGGGLTGTGISNTKGVNTGALKTSMIYTVKCIGKNKMERAEPVFVMVDDGSGNTPEFPTVKLTATPGTIKEGETSTLTWTSTNAVSCKLSGGGLTGTGLNNTVGVKTKALTEGMVYTVTCTGKNGEVMPDSAFVNVIPDLKLPSVTVTAVKNPIDYNTKATIKWESKNTTSCNSGAGNGTGITGTFQTASLKEDKAFTVSCVGPNGAASGSVNIKVNEDNPNNPDDTSGKAQCSDGKDNDGDGLVDELDPNCHQKGDITGVYMPNHDSEAVSPANPNIDTSTTKCKIIDANPLTYTDEEQKQLDELLRKFYLIASTLKTDADLTLAYREIEEYRALVSQVKNITKQCYLQTNDTTDYNNFCNTNPESCGKADMFAKDIAAVDNTKLDYTGPTTRFGNPWFKYDIRGSYLPANNNDLPGDVTMASQCKYCEPNNTGSPYYCGRLGVTSNNLSNIPFCEANGKEMRDSGRASRYYNIFGVPVFGQSGNTGGPTIKSTNMRDFEKILNIW